MSESLSLQWFERFLLFTFPPQSIIVKQLDGLTVTNIWWLQISVLMFSRNKDFICLTSESLRHCYFLSIKSHYTQLLQLNFISHEKYNDIYSTWQLLFDQQPTCQQENKMDQKQQQQPAMVQKQLLPNIPQWAFQHVESKHKMFVFIKHLPR